MVLEVTENNFEEIINNKSLVLIDFCAPWCEPCKIRVPIINELSLDFQYKVIFGRVNVDKYQELATKCKVMSIPTFLLFENGQIINRQVGIASKEQIIRIINEEKV